MNAPRLAYKMEAEQRKKSERSEGNGNQIITHSYENKINVGKMK